MIPTIFVGFAIESVNETLKEDVVFEQINETYIVIKNRQNGYRFNLHATSSGCFAEVLDFKESVLHFESKNLTTKLVPAYQKRISLYDHAILSSNNSKKPSFLDKLKAQPLIE